jgi:MFS family permease
MPSTDLDSPRRARPRLSPAQSLVLLGAILITFLAASTAPSPLYALWREAWGFSALTLTLVFASYAFAQLTTLLVFGALSDHIGRRPVLVAALVIEIASTVLFRQAASVEWLFAARVAQGLATGIATAVLSAALLDVHRERGALLASVSPLAGMALGALGAGALAEFAPAPTQLVFEILLAVLVLQTLLVLRLPETAPPVPGAWDSLKPRLALPRRARAAFMAMLPINTMLWALGGFYSSLGPSLVRIVTGRHSPMLGGAAVAALVLSGAVAILAARRTEPRRTLQAGVWGLLLGISVTLAGVQAHATAAFFVGSVVAGLGFGAGFTGAVRSLVPLAKAHERAGTMATFYVACYLAFAVPAIAAGLAAGRFGLEATALGYGALLVALGAVALTLAPRPEPESEPAASSLYLLTMAPPLD